MPITVRDRIDDTPHVQDAVTVCEREVLEQKGIRECKHRHIGANAERQHHDGYGREAGVPQQRAETVRDVRTQVIEHVSGSVVVCAGG